MKTLVAYYSHTGNTRKVAEKVAKILGADIDEIVDKDNLGEDAVSKKELIEVEFKKDPSKYDLVVIGSPVWAFNIPPATKSYMSKNKFKKVAFFCTCALTKGLLFRKMESLSKKPVATLKVRASKINVSDEKIKDFCSKLEKV